MVVFDLTGRQVAGIRRAVRNEALNYSLPTGTYMVVRTATSSATTNTGHHDCDVEINQIRWRVFSDGEIDPSVSS